MQTFPSGAAVRRSLAEADRESRADAVTRLERAVDAAISVAEAALMDYTSVRDINDIADALAGLHQACDAAERLNGRAE